MPDLTILLTKIRDALGNVINPAKEDGNLATIAGKDFASEATLAGIKTGTDKIISAPATEAKQDDIITGLDDVTVSKLVGTLSTVNSTTTPLGIGGVFTGTAEDVLNYSVTNISIISDKASATDGLSLQWSQDGTNWYEKVTVTILAGIVWSREFGVRARYFRIVYTNGVAAQTYFRLQTIFHMVKTRVGAVPLNVILKENDFAPTTRSVISGRKPGGDYTNIQATTAGNLKVSIEEQDPGAGLATEAKQDDIIAKMPTLTAIGDVSSIPVVVPNFLIEGFESLTGFTYSTDVTNASLSTEHRGRGNYSISFDKSGTTEAFALIQKTITPVNLSTICGHYYINYSIKIPDITDIAYVFVALGSSISDCIYWQKDVIDLIAGWNNLYTSLQSPDGQIGVGIDFSNVTWIGIFIGFNAAANTLSGIKVDNVQLHSIEIVGTAATEEKQDDIVTALNTISGLQVSTDMEGGGKIAVGVTAVEVTFTGTPKVIIISADAANTGELYVGKSNVTSAGANAITFLLPGESVEISYNDVTNAVYVVASVAAQNFYKGALL